MLFKPASSYNLILDDCTKCSLSSTVISYNQLALEKYKMQIWELVQSKVQSNWSVIYNICTLYLGVAQHLSVVE